MAPTVLQFAFAVVFAAVCARADTHTFRFDNKCGKGTPQLIIGGQLVSNGSDYTATGSPSGIAYLQTGECLFNGEQCTLLEFTLNNPTCEGCGSSADVSLIPPHAFNVPAGFSYIDGCEGQGTVCNSATCNTAFFQPDDTWVQVACQTNNVGLLITFCGDGSSASASASAGSPTSASEHTAAPTAPVPPTTVAFSTPIAKTSSVPAFTTAGTAPTLVAIPVKADPSASFSVQQSATASASGLPTRATGKTCKANTNARRAHRRATGFKHRRLAPS